jgi:hypothetical protein
VRRSSFPAIYFLLQIWMKLMLLQYISYYVWTCNLIEINFGIPKHRHIKFRSREITQKQEYNIYTYI